MRINPFTLLYILHKRFTFVTIGLNCDDHLPLVPLVVFHDQRLRKIASIGAPRIYAMVRSLFAFSRPVAIERPVLRQ
jgi:hypothetical protein